MKLRTMARRAPRCGAILVGFWWAVASASAAPNDAPYRRAGIWESTFKEGDGAKKVVDKRCTSPEWESQVADATAAFSAKSCSKNELRKVGATWVSDSVCTMFGKTITSRSVTSGDLQSAIRIETEMRGSDGTVTSTTMEGRWLGPCGPKDKPGAAVKR